MVPQEFESVYQQLPEELPWQDNSQEYWPENSPEQYEQYLPWSCIDLSGLPSSPPENSPPSNDDFLDPGSSHSGDAASESRASSARRVSLF